MLLKRDTSKYSAVIQLSLDKNIITVDYDDICEHVGDVNEFWPHALISGQLFDNGAAIQAYSPEQAFFAADV